MTVMKMRKKTRTTTASDVAITNDAATALVIATVRVVTATVTLSPAATARTAEILKTTTVTATVRMK